MVFERSGKLAGTRRSRHGRTALVAVLLLVAAMAAPVTPRTEASIRRAFPFVAPTSTAGEVRDAAVADFNGDRHLDVLEALSIGGLAVRWGTGNGTYADPVTLDVAGVSATRLVAADMTSDGTSDAVAFAPGSTSLWVVPADGQGGFLPILSLQVSQGVRDIAIADFDRNGSRDIAVASNTTDEIVMLSSTPRADGYTTGSVPLPGRALSIAAVKLDAEGGTDLVVATADGNIRALQNQRGGFAEIGSHHVDFAPELMATGDLDVDGWQDVVVASTSGKLASLNRVKETGLAAPVVSNLEASLTKIAVGYVDTDREMDVVGVGSNITVLFAGLGEGRFDNPRHAIQSATDVSSVTLVDTAGGLRSDLVLSRVSGVTVESVATEASKLRGTFTVTNTDDLRWFCTDPCVPPEEPGVDCDPNATQLETTAPPGSLRAAVEAANASGGGTITFSLPLIGSSPSCDALGFSSASLTWNIAIAQPLVLNGNIQILGETVSDTNPFGPDVGIQPFNNQGMRAALQDEAPDPPEPIFDAFILNGSNNELSTLIIGGTNFGGFPNCTVSPCNGEDDPGTFAVVGASFDNPVTINGGGNVVRGCFINTDQRGFGSASPLPTGIASGGVAIVGGGSNRIGGDAAGDRNVIVSSTHGVSIFGGAGNMIINNILGTDGTIGGRPGGETPLNGVILISATTTEIRDNVIGGSSLTGILLTLNSNGSTIENNQIGVNAEGGTNENDDGGIVINASNDTTVGPANVISNNGAVDAPNSGGVVVTATGSPSLRTAVSMNTITNNTGNGVYIEFGDDSTIGPSNTIANNGFAGVAVARGIGNTITLNSMTSNARLGIDLVAPGDDATGITPNDAGDADTGPNNLLNWPVLTGLTRTSGGVQLAGTAAANSVVEIFQSDNTHPNGEGIVFLVSTTASSTGTFSVTLPVTLPVPDGFSLTATATDTAGNTSEFSPNFNVEASVSVSPSAINFGTVAVGTTATQVLTICNTGLSDLNLSSVTIDPPTAVFTITAVPPEGMLLSPGECTTVTVTFLPTSEAVFSSAIVVTTDDPNNPTTTVPVTGGSQLGSITVEPATITFPRTRVGRMSSTVVTVRNTSDVPVTVSRVDFLRRGPTKINFASRNDPFFTATPSTFTLQPDESMPVTITFRPEEPLPSPDLVAPFDLPTPAYQTPKKINTDVRFVVSDALSIGVTIPARGRVVPLPGITGGSAPPFDDTLQLTLDVYDPDNNLTNAQFVFYNESFIQLFRIDNTPGVARATRRFAKGMNVPLTFTFTGVAPFIDSLEFIDAVVIDAAGNTSNVLRFRVVPDRNRVGSGRVQLIRDGSPGVPERSPVRPGIGLPPIAISPRQ